MNADDFVEENEDEYDYVEGVVSEQTLRHGQQQQQQPVATTSTTTTTTTTSKLMPHEKNALNFLVNEYLLENSYKMTSITFAEENESQDLEDWDVIGLNRSKPPNLLQLYRYFLSRGSKGVEKNDKKAASKTDTENAVKLCEVGTQAGIETGEVETNTTSVERRDFEAHVNFDRETFDNQRTQINKLLEKQEILIKSLSKLESEIAVLNTERESSMKKIDFL